MPPADLVSTEEASRILGIDRSTLSRWVQLGKIHPAMRLSPRGPMLFKRRDVIKLRDRIEDVA